MQLKMLVQPVVWINTNAATQTCAVCTVVYKSNLSGVAAIQG
jgi:hypothetical protein